MSFTIGEELASDQPNQSTCEIKRKSGISYSREFLLSLSELDICKKFPSGFDESILSEFEDMYLERPRILGGLSSQGFRHNEYGSSSPPTRGELGNYGQGIHGRWESRSSGRTDKDAVSQPNRDSDPGGRYAIPSRRGWQAPEHDGLLGSGSFPRSGYIPGTSAPKLCSTDSYQRNRSTEAYQPPRPYKAVPSSRREITDSYNDETFGSSEWTNEDKTEEERKRRDSFESMRKEQQKAFQMNPNKRKDEFDIMTLLDDSRDERRPLNKCSEVDESIEDPVKPSASLQSSRPLVPPGFAGATHEKKYNAGEQQEDKGDDTRSPQTTQSSKFAGWFLEEDRKPVDDPISRPADFSLSGHETNALGSDASDNRQKSFLESPSVADEYIKSDVASGLISKQEAVSAVLTCEDLENSMLSGFNESNKIQPPPRKPQSLLDRGRNKSGSEAPPSANIDDRASLHLLSLLNKRTDMVPNPHVDTKSSYKVDSFEGESVGNAPNNLREAHGSPPVNLGQSSTLETLFGTNFMKELQSVGAPVSSQRGLGGGSAIFEGLGPQGFHSTHINGILPGGEGDLVASGSGTLAPNQRQRSDMDKMEGQYSLFDHFQPEAHRPPLHAQVQSKLDYVTDKQGEMRFAEENSRNSVGDPLSIRGFMPPAKAERGDLFNIAEQLAAISGNFKPLAFRVPFDNNKVDPNSLQNHHHRQQPSPQIQPQQSNSHMGFESYPGLSDSQRNMIPEDSILHDLQSGRRIPSSRMMHPTIRNPNGGVSGFGSPNQHHHLGQQMHMSGNFTTPHQFQGFVRGGSHPQVAAPQPNHQVPGFIHGQNSMQGAFPFGHQHSNFGGPQMPLLGSPEVGGGLNNHPQALQRMIEMELRSKAKQQQMMMHNSQGGSYGHEQDTGFRYNR